MKHQKQSGQSIYIPANLPPLPQILLKLIELCGDDEKDLNALSEILQKDPSLSLSVLKTANSPYYCVNGRVSSIQEAVRVLGANTVKNIAVCTSVNSVFDGRKENGGFSLKAFWHHSLKVAVLSRLIAEGQRHVDAEDAFLSGMFHDIGKLVLWDNFGDQYAQLTDACGNDSGQLLHAETELAADHCKIGSRLLRSWKLHPLMADAALYHHESTDRISTALPLAQIVYLANVFSKVNGRETPGASETARDIFGLETAQIESLIFQAEEETKTVVQSLDMETLSADETPESLSGRQEKPDDDLSLKVKNISLMYGTLQNLMRAEDHEAVLKTVHEGFHVLFGVENVAFFLPDPYGKYLTGITYANNQDVGAVKGLRIPAQIEDSLVNLSLSRKKLVDSFDRSCSRKPVVLDEQITRLLGREGILCLPMWAQGEDLGVIVIGLDMQTFSALSSQLDLLKLYAGQAALALHVDHLKQGRLKRVQSECKSAYAALGGKMVHEVNTPLSIIKNYISILKGKLSSESSIHDELDFIDEELDRVSRSIQVFSYFSKNEELRINPLNVNELISDLTRILIKTNLISPGIEIHLALDHELPVIRTDKNRLKQIFINLLRNAVEAMGSSGNIYIRTWYEKSRVLNPSKQTAGSQADSVEITIKDDGPGSRMG